MLFNVKASLYVLIFLSLTFTINSQLSGNWPPVDKPPPTSDEWNALVDLTKVPNAPISKVAGDCGAKDDFCNWSCTQCVRTNTTDIIQCPDKSDWGLSFDDGPTEFTDTLLDYLASQNIKLTFFIVGSRVTENPQILQKTVNAGHQIGVHTWSHTALTTQTNEEIIAEIKWTELVIKTAVGVTPKYMRPPFGDIDDRVRGILSQLGYKVVIWDKDTNDWLSADDKSFQLDWIEGNFTEWVKEDDPTGHISLEHDLYQQTAAQAPKVVPIVQGAGFTIKPVAVCIGDTKPYLEDVSLGNVTTPTATTPAAAATTPATTLATTAFSDSQVTEQSAESSTYDSSASSNTNNNIYILSLAFFIIELI